MIFPFEYPLPTAFYLCFYILTLVIHVVFMNYVLAGSAWLIVDTIFQNKTDSRNSHQQSFQKAAAMLREWMPLALSGAITAGIAPLLFLQILYKQRFYTANLLAFHRWMSILPTLIVAFYLLYIVKTPRIQNARLWIRAGLGLIVFLCFGFIGWSWTENHLLSLQSQEVWVNQYGSQSWVFRTPELFPRLAVWFIGAFPTMSLCVAWQIELSKNSPRDTEQATEENSHRDIQHFARVALLTLLLAGCAFVFWMYFAGTFRLIFMTENVLYTLMAILGAGWQFASWTRIYKVSKANGNSTRRWLTQATIGCGTTILGMSVLREIMRVSHVDIAALYAEHARAFGVGGFGLFVVFAVVNSGLIVWAIRLTKHRATSA